MVSCPYAHGHSNAFDMDAAFDAAGYRHITWHAHGDDWRPDWTVDQIVQKTMTEVKGRWPESAGIDRPVPLLAEP